MPIKKIKKKLLYKANFKSCQDILVKYIVKKISNKIIEEEVIETKVYIGPYDKVSCL